MTSTAQRWSASNKEFYTICGPLDYAVVGWRSEDVLKEIENAETLQHSASNTFGSFLEDSQHYHYRFARRGSLVYSDVDGTEERRVAMLKREYRLKRPELNEHQKTLSSDLAKVLDLAASDDSDHPEQGDHEYNEDYGLASNDYDNCPMTLVSMDIIDHVIKLKAKDDKVEAMKLVSGELGQDPPRPTMLIIHLLSDRQAVGLGEGSGYVIGYDFAEDKIIVKYYKASPDHHPLDEPWFTISNSDKASFTGSPGQLARHIAQREGLDAADPLFGFALANRVTVGLWILDHQDALSTVQGPEHGDLLDGITLDQLQVTIDAHLKELDTLPFPNKVRYIDPASTHQFTHCYKNVSALLEQSEWHLRRCALEGKAKGQDKAADNLAKFFDGVSKAAVALAKDPEMEFGLWEA